MITLESYLYACLQSGDTKPAIFSDLELKPVGLLEVKLVEARDLKNKDLVGKSDPFAVLYIRRLRPILASVDVITVVRLRGFH